MKRRRSSVKTRFFNLPLKYQLSIIFTAIVLVFVGVLLFSFVMYYRIQTDYWYERTNQELQLIVSGVENQCKGIDKISYSMVEDRELQDTLLHIASENPGSRVSYADESVLMDKVRDYTFKDSAILTVGIITPRTVQYYSRNIQRAYSGKSLAFIEEYGQKFDGRSSWAVLQPEQDGVGCIRAFKSVKPFGIQNLGTLFIEANVSALFQQGEPEHNRRESLLVLDRSTLQTVFSSYEGEQSFARLLQGDSGFGRTRVAGEQYLYSYQLSGYTDWYFLGLTRFDDMFAETFVLQYVLLSICILIYVGGLFLTIRFIGVIISPLEKLTLRMKQVGQGEFHVSEEALAPRKGKTSEIRSLEFDFDRMVHEIDSLIYESYSKELQLRDYELRSLQLEMNPHFLYNTLESIKWKARVCGQTDIVVMANSLGKLLRGVLRQSRPEISLEEELTLLGHYMAIQAIRYEDRLRFESSVQAITAGILVPKLLLQPLVENAIVYGLEQTAKICTVKLMIRQRGERLHLLIKDDGAGMERDFVRRLQQGEIEPRGFGIGIKNIRERLRLLYGDKGKMRVMSRPGIGTVVCISLPLRSKEEESDGGQDDFDIGR